MRIDILLSKSMITLKCFGDAYHKHKYCDNYNQYSFNDYFFQKIKMRNDILISKAMITLKCFVRNAYHKYKYIKTSILLKFMIISFRKSKSDLIFRYQKL